MRRKAIAPGVSIRKMTVESPAGPRTVYEISVLVGKDRQRARVAAARIRSMLIAMRKVGDV